VRTLRETVCLSTDSSTLVKLPSVIACKRQSLPDFGLIACLFDSSWSLFFWCRYRKDRSELPIFMRCIIHTLNPLILPSSSDQEL